MGKKFIGSAALTPSSDTGFDLTTKGDTHGFSNQNARIPISTNNFSLLCDSAESLGLKWAASPTSILDATGKMLYSSSANTLAAISPGAEDTVLTMGGSSVPGWATAAGGSGNTFARVVKKADQTVTNESSPQDDDELVVALSANKNYGFMLTIFAKAGSGGLRTDFTIPTGATGVIVNACYCPGTIGATVDITTARTHATNDSVQFVPLMGRVIMNSTAGNLQFQFAQDSGHANDTTMQEGTFLVVWEETA